MTAKEHMEWAIARSMEYYHQGDKNGALASFLSDVGKHEGTVHIQTNPATLMILRFSLDQGAADWEKALRGFAVFDEPAPAA